MLLVLPKRLPASEPVKYNSWGSIAWKIRIKPRWSLNAFGCLQMRELFIGPHSHTLAFWAQMRRYASLPMDWDATLKLPYA